MLDILSEICQIRCDRAMDRMLAEASAGGIADSLAAASAAADRLGNMALARVAVGCRAVDREGRMFVADKELVASRRVPEVPRGYHCELSIR